MIKLLYYHYKKLKFYSESDEEITEEDTEKELINTNYKKNI